MIYEPREDSYILESEVKKYSKNKTVLDIGSGSGIQAEMALKSGARSVLASDLDNQAIRLLKNKFKNYNNFSLIKSDLFKSVRKDGKFDLIVFNPPYLPQDKREDKESQKATTGGKKGDEIILRFLRQAPKHLNKKGIILLVVSSLTPRQRIKALIKKSNLRKKIIKKKSFFFETLEVWGIYLG